MESKHRPTVYVPVSEFRKLIRSETGIAYGRSSAELTSFVTKDAIYRHTWEVAKADELLEATTKSGLQPSATWSRIARQLLPYPFPKSRGHQVLFRNAGIDVLGGWQWSMPIMAKNATQYDINKAYQWSLLSHVSFEPDIKVYEGYRRNADICIVRCRFNPVYPMPPITRMANSETLVAISPWDLERYNAQVVRCYWSICFQHPDPERLLHCMDRVADWPSEWRDHILRVAWASFAAHSSYGASIEQGKIVKEWQQKNVLYDPARANIVTAAVRAKVYDALPYVRPVIRVYVDSVMGAGGKLPTGSGPGEWRVAARPAVAVLGTGGVTRYAAGSYGGKKKLEAPPVSC